MQENLQKVKERDKNMKNLNIIIRPETENDYYRTEEVAREAFWNLYCMGAEEHYILHKMRSHKDFIKELSFVIEVNGIIEGGIFYTHSKIVLNENIYPTITFGPVFISPKYHRQGLGRQLITYSIEKAKKMNYCAILTLGYDYHYKPYGFCGGKKYNICMQDGKFYKGLLVLPLFENALEQKSGMAVFSDVFDVDKKNVEDFDIKFLQKEKKVLQCQFEYQKACVALDEQIY